MQVYMHTKSYIYGERLQALQSANTSLLQTKIAFDNATAAQSFLRNLRDFIPTLPTDIKLDHMTLQDLLDIALFVAWSDCTKVHKLLPSTPLVY